MSKKSLQNAALYLTARLRCLKARPKQILPTGDTLVPIFIKLPPEHIVSLKFIFETYEGIGVVRALSSLTGEAVILALEDTAQTAKDILASIADELSLVLTAAPASLEGDWLLSEEMA